MISSIFVQKRSNRIIDDWWVVTGIHLAIWVINILKSFSKCKSKHLQNCHIYSYCLLQIWCTGRKRLFLKSGFGYHFENLLWETSHFSNIWSKRIKLTFKISTNCNYYRSPLWFKPKVPTYQQSLWGSLQGIKEKFYVHDS